MIIKILQQTKTAFLLVLFFTFFTGFIYPVVITGIAHLYCPWKANGSIVEHNHKIIGSLLIGQSFDDPKYFWGRLSATSPYPYNAMNSTGSNFGPMNPALLTSVKKRIDELHSADPSNTLLIPVDLVTSSASGLDPDISLSGAAYQIPRIAKARKIPEKFLQILVAHLANARRFSVIGEPRVNVLELNLALDGLESSDATTTSKS